MTTMTRVMMPVFLCVVIAGGAQRVAAQPASGDGGRSTVTRIELSQPFEVGIQTLPAGSYTIEQAGEDLLVLRSAALNKIQIDVPVILRIARTSSEASAATAVFDSYDDKHYLSEIWLPGSEGFLVGYPEPVRLHDSRRQ